MKELELDNTRELEDAIITAIYSGKVEDLTTKAYTVTSVLRVINPALNVGF